jgi:hypothetical protein
MRTKGAVNALLAVSACLIPLAHGMAFGVPTASAVEPTEHRLPSLHQEFTAEGTVARYLIDPRGEVEGLMLTDGTQMHVTSRNASEFINAIKPGHRIRAQGTRKRQPALFEPDVIQNKTTGTFFRTPLRQDLPIPDQENRLSMTAMKASGTIDVLLYDYMNQTVHGMLLSDGTQVRLPPDVSEEFRRSLRVGESVDAEGYGTENEYGRAMEALRLGLQHSALRALDATVKSLHDPAHPAKP